MIFDQNSDGKRDSSIDHGIELLISALGVTTELSSFRQNMILLIARSRAVGSDRVHHTYQRGSDADSPAVVIASTFTTSRKDFTPDLHGRIIDDGRQYGYFQYGVTNEEQKATFISPV